MQQIKLSVQFLVVVFLLSSYPKDVCAQEYQLPETLSRNIISLMPIIQYSNHSAGFTGFGGCITCAKFDNVVFNNSTGLNVGVGVGYEQRFTKKFLLQFRAFFVQNTIDFSTDQAFLTYVSNGGNTPSKVYNQHNLNVKFTTVGMQLMPTLDIYKGLKLGVGAEVDFLLNQTFDYKETLFDETNKRFFSPAGAATRNVQGPTFTNPNSLMIGLAPAISYEIKLAESFSIEPEASYRFIFTNFLNEPDVNWKYQAFNFGVKVNWIFGTGIYGGAELPPCPDGTIRDKDGNCVTVVVQKVVPPPILNSKTCPPGFKRDNVADTCVIDLPQADTTCIGTILAIQMPALEKAKVLLQYLMEKKSITNFKIGKVVDERDKRVTVTQLESGCFENSQKAEEVRRMLYKIFDADKEIFKELGLYNDFQIIIWERK